MSSRTRRSASAVPSKHSFVTIEVDVADVVATVVTATDIVVVADDGDVDVAISGREGRAGVTRDEKPVHKTHRRTATVAHTDLESALLFGFGKKPHKVRVRRIVFNALDGRNERFPDIEGKQG